MWRRFDIIQLITTKNIKFLSGPKGRPANPQGNWSVIGAFPGEGSLLAAKDETVIKVPIHDVRKVGSYDVNTIIDQIKKVKSRRTIQKEYPDGEEDTGKQ